MIRNRTFELVAKTNASSWKTFEEALAYFSNNKRKVEETFSIAAYDYNFDEPMNVIVLVCSEKSSEAKNIQSYVDKFDNLFGNSHEIVIDFRFDNYSDRVHVEHTYFVKKPL